MTNAIGYRNAVPVLPSEYVLALMEYFIDVLGFSKYFVWGDPPVYGAVKAGEALLYINLDPPFVQAMRERDLHPDLFLWVSGVDEHYARHSEYGADVVEQLSNRPWDARQYTLRAPNGYYVKIAEPIGDEDD
jgi:hypothetical protein